MSYISKKEEQRIIEEGLRKDNGQFKKNNEVWKLKEPKKEK